MIQVKILNSFKEEQINNLLANVPDENFVDLKIIGEYRTFGNNNYMLTVKGLPEELAELKLNYRPT